MSARVLALTAGTILLAGAALAGCSSADQSAGAGAQAPNASATQASGSAEADAGAATAPETSSATATPDGQAGGDADAARAGSRCDIGQPYTTGLVVDGSMDCATLGEVWSQAVADPAFAHHGNHNTITVGDWTCRAHQTRPVQTGFCENSSDHAKFKVIHT